MRTTVKFIMSGAVQDFQLRQRTFVRFYRVEKINDLFSLNMCSYMVPKDVKRAIIVLDRDYELHLY